MSQSNILSNKTLADVIFISSYWYKSTAIKLTQCKQQKLKKFNHKYYYKNDEHNQSYNVM